MVKKYKSVSFFNLLVLVEIHYVEKNHGMFFSKTFSTEERKTWNILDEG